MCTIAFDIQGAVTAYGFFLGLWLLLAAILIWNLRFERVGRFNLSRRVRIVGFSIVTLAYLVTLHYWLFLRTFYELRMTEGDRLEIRLILPERKLRVPRAAVASLQQLPGARSGFSRLMIELSDGQRFYSPDRSPIEITRALEKLLRPRQDEGGCSDEPH